MTATFLVLALALLVAGVRVLDRIADERAAALRWRRYPPPMPWVAYGIGLVLMVAAAGFVAAALVGP